MGCGWAVAFGLWAEPSVAFDALAKASLGCGWAVAFDPWAKPSVAFDPLGCSRVVAEL